MAVVSALVVALGCCVVFVSSTPEFTGVAPLVTMYERQATITTLTDTTCTDSQNSSASVIVSFKSSNPACDGCFQVYPTSRCGGSTAPYCLQYLPVDADILRKHSEYTIELECKNSKTGEKVTTEVLLRLYPNTPPSFQGALSLSGTLTGTKNVGEGDTVYSVTCSDPDGDAVSFNLTSQPPNSPFKINPSGKITATQDLRPFCLRAVDFEVWCKDRYHPAVGPVSINLELSGANQRPRIFGLNYQTVVPEDTPVKTVLAEFSVQDDDATTCQFDPSTNSHYFTLSSNPWEVRVENPLDYENSDTHDFNITVTCTDNYCKSSVHYLHVIITDVNEQIILLPANLTLSTVENQFIILDPKWTVTNDDDVAIFSIRGDDSGLFAINSSTGIITSTVKYDVDQGLMPSFVTLLVQVRDSVRHVDTSTIFLTIEDVNDNRPVFIVGSQTITIDDCDSTVGTTIGTTLTVTDSDSGYNGNNHTVFNSDSDGPIIVNATGSIIAGNGIQGGTDYEVNVRATDSGRGPEGPLTSLNEAKIVVIVTHCPTTPPPPTTTTTTNTTTSETTEATTSTVGDTTPNGNDTTIATNTTLDVTTTANDTTTNGNATSECGNNSNEYPRAVPLWHMFPVIAAVILTEYIV